MKKISLVAVIILAAVTYLQNNTSILSSSDSPVVASPSHNNQQSIERAFQKHQSNVQVNGSGTVKHVLRDDNQGSRHQKFILQLPSGQSLLIAHNIDLAPRIKRLKKGDTVEFYGEYEWNNKGGVVHWTHHDPSGRHTDGWLKHKGKTYQ